MFSEVRRNNRCRHGGRDRNDAGWNGCWGRHRGRRRHKDGRCRHDDHGTDDRTGWNRLDRGNGPQMTIEITAA